jgi:cytochrome c oxidase subunit 3
MKLRDRPIGAELPLTREAEIIPRLGGGGSNLPNPPEGFGGDGAGGPEESGLPNYQERLKRCRLGLGLSMLSVTMLFVALSSAYLLRRHTMMRDADGVMVSDWQHLMLPQLLLINTFILLISSFTLEIARRQLKKSTLLAPLESIPGIRPEPQRSLPWLAITLVLGVGFLAGQAFAWHSLQLQGIYLSGNPSHAFFYILTGAHAIHLMVGILALLYAALAHWLAHSLETRCLVVDVTAWYWHFMALLWLYIYALLRFVR